jgi:hypothetical protein
MREGLEDLPLPGENILQITIQPGTEIAGINFLPVGRDIEFNRIFANLFDGPNDAFDIRTFITVPRAVRGELLEGKNGDLPKKIVTGPIPWTLIIFPRWTARSGHLGRLPLQKDSKRLPIPEFFTAAEAYIVLPPSMARTCPVT